MSKKYEGLASAIVEKVGGPDNIGAVRHCQTRLRFTLKDTGIADKDSIQSLNGVAQVVESGGMFQVVIGMHVADVFEEVEKLIPNKEGEAAQDKGNKEKMSPVNFAIDFVSSVFQPIVPALSGAGMLKALMALLTVFHLVDSGSQSYYILNFFCGCGFYIPVASAGIYNGQKNEVQCGAGNFRSRHYVPSELGGSGNSGRAGKLFRHDSVLSGGIYVNGYPDYSGDCGTVFCGKGIEQNNSQGC